MFIEEKISTKIEDRYDVAICGGGVAGISAALAAARNGKKVCMLLNRIVFAFVRFSSLSVPLYE